MELILVLSILRVTNIDRNSAWWETDKRWNLYEFNLWHKLKKDESSEVLGNTSVNNIWGFHYSQSLPYLIYFLHLSATRECAPIPSWCPHEAFSLFWPLSFLLETPHFLLSSPLMYQSIKLMMLKQRSKEIHVHWVPVIIILGSLHTSF